MVPVYRRESEMKPSWDTGVKEALHWESVTDQMAVSCQDHLCLARPVRMTGRVLLAALQPCPVWLLI